MGKRLDWRIKCRLMLVDGFGVEDIAIVLDHPVREVRHLVSLLRKHGQLEGLFK